MRVQTHPNPCALTIHFEAIDKDGVRRDLVHAFLYALLPFEQASKCEVGNALAGQLHVSILTPSGKFVQPIIDGFEGRVWEQWMPESGVTRLQGEAHCRMSDPLVAGLWN